MNSAIKSTGLKTKQEVVEEGLKLLIQIREHTKLKTCVVNFGGKAILMK